MERRRDRDRAILRVCVPSRRKPEPAEAALNATPNPTHAGDSELLERIVRSTGDAPVQTKLRTDERVLARVTDGIYRQPGSAIRELLSNAYDADATRVVIRTDRPRFQTITVEDDGRGMSPETVVHVLQHIGGSAKRSREGVELGITSGSDPLRSPGGRRLIGKIGIGLFSVAQLTHRFQIITKTEGDSFRTIAAVALRQYSDDVRPAGDEHDEYEAGIVNVWREPAPDKDGHGTTIVLTDIRPQTRDTLRSAELWAAIDSDGELGPDDARDLRAPAFHIGRLQRSDGPEDTYAGAPGAIESLPWDAGDAPQSAFTKLVNAVWQHIGRGSPNPQLDRIFDYYLRMVWQLSLAIPAPYVQGSPFDIAFADDVYLYDMPAKVRGAPSAITLAAGQTVREVTGIGAAANVGDSFQVLFDDLQLVRPLAFTDLPATSHAVRKPILFVGSCREDFVGIAPELTGGPLHFEAYLMWAPKIAPTEHQGSLIRIHGASGTLFDPTFMRYQVSEQTRLRQISCEIFVTAGLEAALNIDRESFNFAHPHVVYLTKWRHAALRRVATVQKRIAADIRSEARDAAAAEAEQNLADVATEAWQEESDDPGAEPPPVEFDDDVAAPTAPGATAPYRYRHDAVFGKAKRASQTTPTERKMKAVVQLLAAFNVLDSLNPDQQERLLAGLRKIIEAPEP